MNSSIRLVAGKIWKSGAKRKSKEEKTCRRITTLKSTLHFCLDISVTLVRLELTNPSRKTSCIAAEARKFRQ